MDEPQGLKNSFNEKMRLIRFRRKKEKLHFWNEFKLVPRWLTQTVLVLFILAQIIAQVVLSYQLRHDPKSTFAPELSNQPVLAALALFGIVTAVSVMMAALIFMVGYVNKDARRRGMHSGLWTFLVIVLIPGYFVLGFIIYMLMREPLPYNCPQCGTTVGGRFNFCPNCKCALHRACPQCKHEIAETDKFCAFCGQDLVSPAAESTQLPAASGSI
jgi:hypothetical protein